MKIIIMDLLKIMSMMVMVKIMEEVLKNFNFIKNQQDNQQHYFMEFIYYQHLFSQVLSQAYIIIFAAFNYLKIVVDFIKKVTAVINLNSRFNLD